MKKDVDKSTSLTSSLHFSEVNYFTLLVLKAEFPLLVTIKGVSSMLC